MDGILLPQSYRVTARRQFNFAFKFPEIPGTHLIDLGSTEDRVDLEATH